MIRSFWTNPVSPSPRRALPTDGGASAARAETASTRAPITCSEAARAARSDSTSERSAAICARISARSRAASASRSSRARASAAAAAAVASSTGGHGLPDSAGPTWTPPFLTSALFGGAGASSCCATAGTDASNDAATNHADRRPGPRV
jgi:hypothetical protein